MAEPKKVGNGSRPPSSLLLARAFLLILEREAPEVIRFINSLDQAGRLRRFPDGSVLVEHTEDFEPYWAVYAQHPTDYAMHVWRPLAPFSFRLYYLLFPKDYDESLMPTPFIAGPCGNTPRPLESRLERLAITSVFKRRPSRKTMRLYTEMVGDWLASVKLNGIFGEGGITPVQPAEMVFWSNGAQFYVDAQKSGQNTLNWFILKALDFGMEVTAINVVLLDSDEHVESWLGSMTGKITRLPIDSGTGAGRQSIRITTEEEVVSSKLPGDCVPFDGVASQLRFFARPYFEWDALTITVYFGRDPRSEDQDEFRKLIGAWGTIGYYGGLGGKGIALLRDVHYDEATSSASFYVNMGDADEQISLSLLARILESYSALLPIDSVVLGSGL